MKAVASRDEIARQLAEVAVVAVANLRRGSVEVVDTDRVRLEDNLAAGRQPRRDQILDDFVLSVDGHRAPSGQPAQIDAMSTAAEAQFDPVMHETQTLHPLADAGFIQQVDGALLEQPGANALFCISAAANLEHDGFDAGKMQQVRQHQPSRSRANNPDLCATVHLFLEVQSLSNRTILRG